MGAWFNAMRLNPKALISKQIRQLELSRARSGTNSETEARTMRSVLTRALLHSGGWHSIRFDHARILDIPFRWNIIGRPSKNLLEFVQRVSSLEFEREQKKIEHSLK